MRHALFPPPSVSARPSGAARLPERGDGANVDLAIVSAAVLDRYPGKDTVAALKRALCHRNWYVRYNAASSLVRLGASQAELQDVFEGNDAFARDILQYMLEEKEMGRV